MAQQAPPVEAFSYHASLLDLVPEIAPDSIVSRTVSNTNGVRIILFGFAPGQELSEHTSTRRALLQFVQGEAEVTLGTAHFTAQAGAFAVMEPNLPHSIRALTTTVMLLIMIDDKPS